MLNAIATRNQIATSDENSTALLLGLLTLIACLLNVIAALTNPGIAAAVALMGTV